MFRKSIICRVGTWHAELELNKSPKHGLRLGKVVENEGSDMRGRGTKEPLRLLRLYMLPSANIHERLMSPSLAARSDGISAVSWQRWFRIVKADVDVSSECRK
jgi:hypothetical protein